MLEKYAGGSEGKKKRFRLRVKTELPVFRKSDGLPGTQIIDKERDPYRHTIVDEEGTVLHDETRRLSEHQERGSAKFQKPSSDPWRYLSPTRTVIVRHS
jgi:hypothetical protein